MKNYYSSVVWDEDTNMFRALDVVDDVMVSDKIYANCVCYQSSGCIILSLAAVDESGDIVETSCYTAWMDKKIKEMLDLGFPPAEAIRCVCF